MDKILSAYGYGIALFSLPTLQEFLKTEKIRSKKLLTRLQKDKDLYLKTLEQGIFLPIVQIDAGGYLIKLDGYDEPFDGNGNLNWSTTNLISMSGTACVSLTLNRLIFLTQKSLTSMRTPPRPWTT